jgi:glutamate-5-semialdehyde dehydrogenase
MKILSSEVKNRVLNSMIKIIEARRPEILTANRNDINSFGNADTVLLDRLLLNDKKIDGMIQALAEVAQQNDPVGIHLDERTLDNGLTIINKTVPFGTILIIYESRPDVTIEAAALAFKANNRILLKGGKEASNSNRVLVSCWHRALEQNGLESSWIQFLQLDREETRSFLTSPSEKIDLIVPRGGEGLISFVQKHAKCPVIVSGRGNNFAYVADDADWEIVKEVVLNAKTQKISACNALDKLLINHSLPDLVPKIKELVTMLHASQVQILADDNLLSILGNVGEITSDEVWYEEFLALKIAIGLVNDQEEAIEKINKYSGGHSSLIFTQDADKAGDFMEQVDSAVVYQNASTRFTDGGQMGIGAELAISTDKLHHRGPLGLNRLVTNKYYVYGTGQIRN